MTNHMTMPDIGYGVDLTGLMNCNFSIL